MHHYYWFNSQIQNSRQNIVLVVAYFHVFMCVDTALFIFIFTMVIVNDIF